MAYKRDEETRENIQLNKTEIELNHDHHHTRKRRACDQSYNSVPQVYVSDEISREEGQPSNSSQDKIYKNNGAVMPANQLRTIERTEIRKVVTENGFDRAIIFAALNSIPGFLQDSQISIAIPATLCIKPLLHREIEDHCNFLSHIREREKLMRPRPFYLNNQLEVDEYTRAILVNWLVSVANELNLEMETLYLTVAYVDQFLSRIVLSRNGLLLMGVTAILIAAKYEETSPPSITKFSFLGGMNFDTKEIIKMERLLLSTLSYDLHIPTVYTFTSAFALLTNLPHLPSYLALYICELSLLETEPYVQFLPSQISAASHALARYILGYSIWSKELEAITLYRVEDLKWITMLLCETHFRANNFIFSSTKIKFMQERYHQVALIGALSMNEFHFDQIVQKYYLLD